MLVHIEGSYYISADSTYTDDRALILNHADTFGVFNRWGDILPFGKEVQGLYHEGTRFISYLEFLLNNKKTVLLSSAIRENNEIFYANLTNPDIKNDQDEIIIPKGNIHVNRSKFLLNGISYEKFKLSNFGRDKHILKLEFIIDGDFKDIFEIRGLKRENRGKIKDRTTNKEKGENQLVYLGLDQVERSSISRFSPLPDEVMDKSVIYHITLEPRQSFEVEHTIRLKVGEKSPEALSYKAASKLMKADLKKSTEHIARISSSSESFNHWINRSRADLVSVIADTEHGRYPYAGVPWYNTPFGRDGIITAYEMLWAAPEIAKGVLLYLADMQAKEVDDSKDAQPGKIVHEQRKGEMADLDEVPFKLYYGTVDATPLFIMLAGKYYTRTGDLDTIKKIWSNIAAALNWIKEYGDIDGDGFIEYQHKTDRGLINQGWKDSWDAVSHEDGRLAEPPIALCEVQGYVYDAKIQAAMLAKKLGLHDTSVELEYEAGQLKKKFNETFWDDELKCYVLALDGNKDPCRVKSSNAGHTLFTGIASEEYAGILARTLLSPEMFTEWGVRTLASSASRYNPMSYHNGSVWPHDTALITYGLSKYGFQSEVLKITKAMYDVSLFIEMQRLPELFCGFARREEEGPIAYPVACSPQAWAVAAVYMLIQSCLKLEIDSLEKKIYFNSPALPEFISHLHISGLILDGSDVRLELKGYPKDVGINVLYKPEDWKVVITK